MLDRRRKSSGIPATLSGTGNVASIHWSGPARNHMVQSVRVVEAQLGNQFQASVNYSRLHCGSVFGGRRRAAESTARDEPEDGPLQLQAAVEPAADTSGAFCSYWACQNRTAHRLWLGFVVNAHEAVYNLPIKNRMRMTNSATPTNPPPPMGPQWEYP